jgi:hypothetical protein
VPKDNPAFAGVVRRQFDGHNITGQATNFMQHHPPRNRGSDGVAIFQHHITPVAMHCRNGAINHNMVMLAAHDAQV